ncbi:hypothetical protein COCSUDRAFT_12091 [Coccomyxa subellipsoidea C-169]|uniref:LMBR1-domain-containing protein n=1 Tax=Coccomyxa subellipsoidea (strain C-169) TaxID=574566 RepID=I0Z8K5_COCSC|nr:hypothetical protein COCSUDRAFT_12091 [Coccomyxa subellipsoidea C-169]EIE26974.1 hypothetical protein COCSUDRAFT_12091 [Coccomyxa subellipsoidea C-169]|eukprot:XP_005651518.1 hypothetical protein COCSUDRAFT_12091 [Coccomyxa subellipsoidea C-169]
MAGFAWFLIVVTVVIAALAVLTALYLLVHYMHPEDKNQAWFPKIVVIVGITLAIWTVLLFPLDAANRKACSPDVPVSYCTLTIPTRQLWLACFIANAVLTFIVIPFAMFYYEADSESTAGQRWMHALLWEAATVVTFGLILGICYALVGFVEYPVAPLISGLSPVQALHANSTLVDTCAGSVCKPTQCDAINGNAGTQIWKLRCSFPIYIIAMSATAGWLLFMVFAGVGFVALPLDLIRDFIGRPKATITHSEYIKRAKALGVRAKAVKEIVDTLKKEERADGRGRKWRGAFRRIQQQLIDLEADSKALELVFPQADDPGYAWAVTVMGFYLQAFGGLIGAVLSVAWLVHVVLYMFVYPPISPFLNSFFITLDGAFPLFGTVAFALFCFYLIAITIKGCTKVGLLLLVFTVRPMRAGATLMNDMLFNVALVLLATNAAIQFCAQAFALYANQMAIHEIWGDQILHLMGIKYLYQLNVFVYCMFFFIAATILVLMIRGPAKWKRVSQEERYAAAYAG